MRLSGYKVFIAFLTLIALYQFSIRSFTTTTLDSIVVKPSKQQSISDDFNQLLVDEMQKVDELMSLLESKRLELSKREQHIDLLSSLLSERDERLEQKSSLLLKVQKKLDDVLSGGNGGNGGLVGGGGAQEEWIYSNDVDAFDNVLQRYRVDQRQSADKACSLPKSFRVGQTDNDLTYAVYRILYGDDFLQLSVESVLPFVDKVFIFWTNRTWADVDSAVYLGETYAIPTPVDQMKSVIDRLVQLYGESKIVERYDHVPNNTNQVTHLVNDIIIKEFSKPDIVSVFKNTLLKFDFCFFAFCNLPKRCR
jgi:hypothetical protein